MRTVPVGSTKAILIKIRDFHVLTIPLLLKCFKYSKNVLTKFHNIQKLHKILIKVSREITTQMLKLYGES